AAASAHGIGTGLSLECADSCAAGLDLNHAHTLPGTLTVCVAIMQVGGVLAAPLMGELSDRLGRRRILTAGMLAASVAIVLVVVVQIDWLLVGVMAVLGFFVYSLRPIMQAWALEHSDEQVAGTVTSLLFAAQSGLGAVAPLVGGLLA